MGVILQLPGPLPAGLFLGPAAATGSASGVRQPTGAGWRRIRLRSTARPNRENHPDASFTNSRLAHHEHPCINDVRPDFAGIFVKIGQQRCIGAIAGLRRGIRVIRIRGAELLSPPPANRAYWRRDFGWSPRLSGGLWTLGQHYRQRLYYPRFWNSVELKWLEPKLSSLPSRRLQASVMDLAAGSLSLSLCLCLCPRCLCLCLCLYLSLCLCLCLCS